MTQNNPIRVLMVTPFPEIEDQVVGGVAGVAYYLCKHLSEISDIDVEVLVPDADCQQLEVRSLAGIKVTFLPRIKQHPIARVLAPQVAKEIGEFADKGNFDLVHIQAAPEWSTHIKQPVITTIHGINEQDMLFRGGNALKRKLIWPLMRFVEQRKRATIKNLIVISPYVRTAIGKALKGRSWDIENPVREDFFHVQREPEPNTIIFAGVIISRKNVARLVQAMAKVRETIPDAKLRIAGNMSDKAYGNYCLAEVERLGLQENVEFLGSLNVDEMQEQLRTSQIMALTSLQETAPLSIEEAMAAGMPVVSSNICGMPYMIEDGVTGALVDPLNIDSIANGLITALQLDLPQAAAISANIARSRFRGVVVARQTAAAYRDILGIATPAQEKVTRMTARETPEAA
ncbi:MAG: glycosyltransferase family 4 protein [Granulosicoccaceae bacterium]